jgi:hypothetical protein
MDAKCADIIADLSCQGHAVMWVLDGFDPDVLILVAHSRRLPSVFFFFPYACNSYH